MAAFFPHVTSTFKIEEPPALRRFSMSILEMGVVTGILLRLYRALVLSQGPEQSLLYVSGMFTLGLAFLFGMTTLHLGNYTIRHWLWRVPAFALIEATAESLTSLALIALHREPMGSARATFADWPDLVLRTFPWRFAIILTFSLVLAGVVQLVRYGLLRREHRAHTLTAVHHEAQLHAKEKQEEQS
jgi:hypothetical protein